MSERYPGGIITKSPATPTGPYNTGAAPGIWTLEQQLQFQQQGVWPTAGLSPNYIEEVFSTYLYNGNGSTQTITNGINLSTNGGLVWIKCRTPTNYNNWLSDTVRGNTKRSSSNTAGAESTLSTSITSFNSNGFSVGSNSNVNDNGANEKFVSWTFREQPKFFDVVTWSGDNTGNRAIPHSLGSMPSFFPIKQTNGGESWWTYQRSVTSPNANWWRNYGMLNSTNAFDDWGDDSGLYQAPDANNLYIGSWYNASGKTYVAYLFAHNAGGFGLSGTDNVISCGSFTTDGSSNATITLGYEPQWLMVKRTNGLGPWYLMDIMRNFKTYSATTYNSNLEANTSNTEDPTGFYGGPTSQGFNAAGLGANNSFIYVAIRRGPMKVPTSGTSVFSPNTYTGNGSTGQTFTNTVNNGGSLVVIKGLNAFFPPAWYDQLRGVGNALVSNSAAGDQQAGAGYEVNAFTNTGFSLGGNYNLDVNNTSAPFVYWQFVRAPSFFDEVCYTGTGSATTVAHNLGAVPELMIVKRRTVSSGEWNVYTASVGNTSTMYLNLTNAPDASAGYWNNTTPTSSVFSIGTNIGFNASGSAYVAYLFATCAGVSKVGSYTGNGTTQTIDCGFTGGARFVIIKRTDAGSTGPWYVYDTARGMTVLTDPYLLLDSTAAEVPTLGSVTTVSTGFAVDNTVLAGINAASPAAYIFLAIA